MFLKKTIKACNLSFLILFMGVNVLAQKKTIDQKADSILRLMTLEEKIGQLNQYTGDWESTGPITKDGKKQDQIRKGLVGSMLNVKGVKHTKTLQQIAMQSRLQIPLLFGQDVIHGHRTIFPVPLAEAASWDLDAIQSSARIAAVEASAAGIHWTFAPMVDIARDPRWGRVMEGAGEDTYLGSKIAYARVKGFQGNGLGNIDAVMACAKHFAAYGAAVGGRDYNSVDMSLKQLYEVYLPPFKAAVDAGAATFMNSFNDVNGIPATGNAFIQRKILKGEWNFKGFVVSDWGSIGEMIQHGYVKNNYEAALSAITAGNDMDMESRSYINNLSKLVQDGKVKEGLIDDAVKRILIKKFELGLFDDPYKFCNEEREKEQWNNQEHIKIERDVARKSVVLLKNEGKEPLLPFSTIKPYKNIALIGPLVKAKGENNGFWSYDYSDDSARIVSLWDGIQNKIGTRAKLLYAKGCNINDTIRSGFAEAINIAKQSDIVVISVGEARDMSGEAKSRSNIHLPGVQEELIKAVYATGKPVVVLISAGRPLIFNWTADNIPSILYTWWLGTQAGNAIADILFGDYNPSAKLPMSFPLAEGQIPIYYNHFNTGRPARNDSDKFYRSSYLDISINPKYVFGYGLSYTTFKYSDVKLSSINLSGNQTLTVSVNIANTGKYDGNEVAQLYIRQLFGSVVRPVKELKGFQKVYNNDLKFDWEAGSFDIMIGGNSKDLVKTTIKWDK